MSIKRIHHPYWRWEETTANMWGSVKNKSVMLERMIEFTGNYLAYGEQMMNVVDSWKYSCEHNLSNQTQNRKAWIGHAACAFKFNCPEDIVRNAWGYLTKDQQDLANNEADIAIKYWENKYGENRAWYRCFDSSEATDILDVRQFRGCIFVIQCREGQHSDVAPCCGRGKKKEKTLWVVTG